MKVVGIIGGTRHRQRATSGPSAAARILSATAATHCCKPGVRMGGGGVPGRWCTRPREHTPAQRCPRPLQADAPALVLQGLAVKLGPTFVKLAQTLRWGRPALGVYTRSVCLRAAVQAAGSSPAATQGRRLAGQQWAPARRASRDDVPRVVILRQRESLKPGCACAAPRNTLGFAFWGLCSRPQHAARPDWGELCGGAGGAAGQRGAV